MNDRGRRNEGTESGLPSWEAARLTRAVEALGTAAATTVEMECTVTCNVLILYERNTKLVPDILRFVSFDPDGKVPWD